MVVGANAIPRLGGVALLMALLSACGDQGRTAQPPRPVLVAHPGAVEAQKAGGTAAFAGEIRAREESVLAFRVGGKLARRLVDVGDTVHRDDVLAELDPGDLQLQAEASQAQLAAAEAQLARVRADHARFATLAKDQLVSRSLFDQQTAALRAAESDVRAARAQRDVASNQSGYSRLRAPADGVIGQRMAEAGQVLAPGQAVFSFLSEGEREVSFALPESNIGDYAPGQSVLVELWFSDGTLLPGKIREISAVADPITRTYAARATLDPGAVEKVTIGQSARVYIVGVGRAGVLLVPLSAVRRDGKGQTTVWVADPKTQRARQVRVVVGQYAADSAPVLSGLKAEDWVVIAGGHLLYEGQPVVPVDRSNRPVPSEPVAVAATSPLALPAPLEPPVAAAPAASLDTEASVEPVAPASGSAASATPTPVSADTGASAPNALAPAAAGVSR